MWCAGPVHSLFKDTLVDGFNKLRGVPLGEHSVRATNPSKLLILCTSMPKLIGYVLRVRSHALMFMHEAPSFLGLLSLKLSIHSSRSLRVSLNSTMKRIHRASFQYLQPPGSSTHKLPPLRFTTRATSNATITSSQTSYDGP